MSNKEPMPSNTIGLQDPAIRLATAVNTPMSTTVTGIQNSASSSATAGQSITDTLRQYNANIVTNLPKLTTNNDPSTFDPATNVKIGITIPTVPPQNVVVKEVKNSLQVDALRNENSFNEKSGRGYIQISMGLAFPTLDTINKELQEIILQFQSSPFLTIESKFISDAVFGSLNPSIKTGTDSKFFNKSSEAKTALSLYVEKLNEYRGYLQTLGASSELYLQVIAGAEPWKINKVTKSVTAELDTKSLNTAQSAILRDLPAAQKRLEELYDKWLAASEEYRNISRQVFSLATASNTVPVCLQSLTVSPIPNVPHGLMCELNLVVFNHFPYTPRFLYRNATGGWTPDISKCPNWKFYLDTNKLVKDVTDYNPDSVATTIRYDSIYLDPDLNESQYNSSSIAFTIGGSVSAEKKLLEGTLDLDNIILANNSFSIFNKLIFLPVLSGEYPTVQYMGNMPGEVQLEFIVPDDKLSLFTDMKRSLSQVALHSTNRKLRKAALRIEGSGLPVCLAGYNEFQLMSSSTESICPTHSKVSLTLSVYKSTKADELKFDSQKSGLQDEAILKEKLYLLGRKAEEYKIQTRAKVVEILDENTRAASLYSIKLPNVQDDMPSSAFTLMYGYDTAVGLSSTLPEDTKFAFGGILNKDVLISLLEKYPDLKQVFNNRLEASLNIHFPHIEVFGFDGIGTTANRDLQKFLEKNNKKEIISARMAGEALWFSFVSPFGGPTKEEIDIIFSRIARDADFSVPMTRLVALDLGTIGSLLPLSNELRETIDRSFWRQLDKENNYPDLNLPTYGELLNTFIEKYNQNNSTDFDTKAIPPEAHSIIRALTGAPTYRDLGIYDVREDARDILAIELNDYVEPDFYFWNFSARNALDAGQKVAKDEVTRLSNSASRRVVRQIEEMTAVFEEGKSRIEQKLVYGQLTPRQIAGIASRTTDLPAAILPPEFADGRDYGRSTDVLLEQGIDPNSTTRTLDLFRKKQNTLKDDFYRMVRAYPAFRFYIIEEDSEELLLIDDWFGFNAVRNIAVTRHKHEPDVAEIELININGTLDEEGFTKLNGSQDFTNPESIKSREPVSDEISPYLLTKFPIQEGTRIVIKLGYGSTEDSLETVFTGKVVELNVGDIVTVLAQGYGVELTMPITENIDLDGFTTKLLSKTGFLPRKHNILNLVEGVFAASPAEHFGKWGLRNIKNAIAGSIVDLTKNQAPTEGRFPFLAAKTTKALLADERLLNIFTNLPLEKRILRINKDDTTLNDEEHMTQWLTGGKTGLEILKELNYHHPELEMGILPFDGRATLFYGRPEDEYFATDKYRVEAIRAEAQERSVLKAYEKQAVGNFKGQDFSKLIERFKASEYFTQYLNYKKLKEDGTAELFIDKIVASDQASANTLYAKYKDFCESDVGIEACIKALFDIKNISSQTTVFGERGLTLIVETPGTKSVAEFGDFELFWKEIAEIGFNGLDPKHVIKQLTEAESISDAAYAAFIGIPLGLGGALLSTPDPFYAFSRQDLRRLCNLYLEFLNSLDVATMPGAITSLRSLRYSKDSIVRTGKKPFRQYHFVDSVHHIMQNNIVATRTEINNFIKLLNPSGEKWASLDDDLFIGDISIGTREAPNAIFARQQLIASYAHLAESIKPMYRGELILRGNSNIKPNDVVWMLDLYNGMWGPVEVERVIHHFDMDNGFTTTVIPHMHAQASNTASWEETTGFNIKMGLAGLGVTTAGIILGAVAGTAGGAVGVGLGALAGGSFSNEIFNDVTEIEAGSAGVFASLTGAGSFGRKENPVRFFPLIVKGREFTAGIRGFRPDSYDFFGAFVDELEGTKPKEQRRGNNIIRKWQDYKRGANRLIRTWDTISAQIQLGLI